MMPVVHGENETRRQIVLYTLPARRADDAAGRLRLLRGIYGPRRSALGGRVPRPGDPPAAPRRPQSALRTYLYSLAYLAVLFGAMVADARL